MRKKGELILSPREVGILDFAEVTRDKLGDQPDREALVFLWALRFGGVRQPLSQVELDLATPPGTADVYLRLTHATQVDALSGFLNADQQDFLKRRLRGASRERRNWPSAWRIVRALAIHYLSKKGGGSRTVEEAHALYSERFPDEAWDEREHYQLIGDIRAEWGPLAA